MPKPLPSALPLIPPLQPPPSCLVWHLCLGVLWWNAARLLFLCRCSLLAALHYAATLVLHAVTCHRLKNKKKKGGGGDGVGSKFKGQCLRKNWCSCFPSLLFGYTWSWAEILTSPLVLTKLILLLLHHFRQRKVTSVFRQLKRLCRPRCCSQVLHGLIQQWMKPCCAVCEDERSHSSIRPNRG